VDLLTFRRWHFRDPHVEEGRDDDEEAEADELDEQAAHDDALTRMDLTFVLGHSENTAAAALHEEGYDVGCDEELGQPSQRDERVLGAVDEPDDAAEDHVHGRGEERRRDEDEY